MPIARAACVAFFVLLAWSGIAEARPVTAVWDANTDAVTSGYRLYYGTSPGLYSVEIDVGNVTSHRLDLTPGTMYFFVVRAYNSSGGVGPPSDEAAITLPNLAPMVLNPGDLVVGAGPISGQFPAIDPDGDPLTFTATGLPPATSIHPTTGALSGSLSPAGTYNVTVTVSDGNLSAQATFRLTVVGTSCAGPPGAATMHAATISGNQVSLTWSASATGIRPDSYRFEAGSSAGQSNLIAVELPVSLPRLVATAPNGQYFVRVIGRNACGQTPSNEISFTIGSPPPGPPTLTFQRSGPAVTLSWTAPGGSPTAYVIEVGTASGLANLVVFNTGSTATSFPATAPPGRYFVRVRALNANGVGAASNEVVITVP